jgi:membrane-associated protease RseP (regulator of RpoE activity)
MQTSPPKTQDAAAEIESLKRIVERYFRVYEARVNADVFSFHCEVEKSMLEENFRRLRIELSSGGYTPVITYQKGEYVLTIGKLPPTSTRGVWVNVVLLIATVLSTIFAGMELWMSYSGKPADSLFSLDVVLMGALTFALPLLAILGIHEMSHYFAARRHGVPASLPFFIPAPFLFIGTFGAFISIRGPIPDRKSLFDLGVAGPIAGFIATIPVAIIGTILTTNGAVPVPAETGGGLSVSLPLIYDFMNLFMPTPSNVLMHPTAMAAWVGFLVTAINLLPAGSLDGGHIARAVFGPKYRYASWATVIVLLVIGSVWYTGWLIFALLILFLGMEHSPPLNDIAPISKKRKTASIAIAVILVSCFAVIPLQNIPYDYSFQAELEGSADSNISLGMNHTYTISIGSEGNTNTTLFFDLQPSTLKADIAPSLVYRLEGSQVNVTSPDRQLTIPVGGNATAYFTITLSHSIQQTKQAAGNISISATKDAAASKQIPIEVSELAGNISFNVSTVSLTMGGNQTASCLLNATNDYSYPVSLQITVLSPLGWSAWVYLTDLANATSRLNATLAADSNASFTIGIQSPLTVTSGGIYTIEIEVALADYNEMDTYDITVTGA